MLFVLASLARLWLFEPAEPDPNRGACGGARRLAFAANVAVARGAEAGGDG
jgi:hypothetical protein